MEPKGGNSSMYNFILSKYGVPSIRDIIKKMLFIMFTCLCFVFFPQVIILSHVPPGIFEKYNSLMWFYNKFNTRYVRILQKFSDIITAQIYGHEHTDSFRILNDTQGMSGDIRNNLFILWNQLFVKRYLYLRIFS